jgi:hypothetical protein
MVSSNVWGLMASCLRGASQQQAATTDSYCLQGNQDEVSSIWRGSGWCATCCHMLS